VQFLLSDLRFYVQPRHTFCSLQLATIEEEAVRCSLQLPLKKSSDVRSDVPSDVPLKN